mmetsp:Transcript_11967/g.35942  ORF Transcript_11967/g.35942 Transcript_11967/m.35942 type:complete len:209 (-) Transcript_11967:1496-2122(-)
MQDDTQTVNVHLSAALAAHQNLRRRPDERANHGLCSQVVVGHQPRQTHVRDLGPSLRSQQHIRGLQVQVHNLVVMQESEPLRDVQGDLLAQPWSGAATRGPTASPPQLPGHVFTQRRPQIPDQQLHDEQQMPAGLQAGAPVSHHIGMLQRLQHLHLLPCRHLLFLLAPDLKHLHGHLLPSQYRLVHRPEVSGPQTAGAPLVVVLQLKL